MLLGLRREKSRAKKSFLYKISCAPGSACIHLQVLGDLFATRGSCAYVEQSCVEVSFHAPPGSPASVLQCYDIKKSLARVCDLTYYLCAALTQAASSQPHVAVAAGNHETVSRTLHIQAAKVVAAHAASIGDALLGVPLLCSAGLPQEGVAALQEAGLWRYAATLTAHTLKVGLSLLAWFFSPSPV